MLNINFPDAFTTPILLVTFNRLYETKQVFESIRKVRPTILYISSDGPRESILNEESIVLEIRNWLINNIDWECNLHTLFRETNVGVKRNVSSSIDWLFEKEQCGIILEDDIVPNVDFFYFQHNLLIKYKDNIKVMMITGTNLLDCSTPSVAPYFFSEVFHVHGWGTWKRAWKLYDREMSGFNEELLVRLLEKKNTSKSTILNWIEFFKVVKNPIVDMWDFQWIFSCWFNEGLCVTPGVNLVSNVGALGSYAVEKQDYNFRATYNLPLELYVDYNPNIETYQSYDSKVTSENMVSMTLALKERFNI